MKVFSGLLGILMALSVPTALQAQDGLPDAFHAGTAIPEYGPIATIDDPDMTIPEGTEFKIAFDMANGADAGELNRSLVSLARFINMHVEAGVPAEKIKLAMVVHGSAVFDVSDNLTYGSKHTPGRDDKMPNPNIALMDKLLNKGVRIIVCGQSAAAYDVSKGNLHKGVEMALSAMTAHALLQQDGYTLNPF